MAHNSLVRTIRHAEADDLVGRNVAELVSALTGPAGRPSKSLTLQQAQALVKAAEASRLHAYIVLCLLTGCRTEEARALRWDHVDLDGEPGAEPPIPSHVAVWRSVRSHGDVKTQKSRRTLRLPVAVVDALRAHKVKQAEDRLLLVFASAVGTPLDPSHVRRAFRKVCEAAGIGTNWTPREMRHTFVSIMSEQGVPGKLTKLVHACGVLVRSVPRLRAQYRERRRRARPPGVLRGRAMGRLAKELGGTREIGVTLQHVAELFVQDFADHFFIDLFHGDVLIRRVERHKGDWTPPLGTWARVGEQIRYPEGHFCQQAMARRDTVFVPNLVMEDIPAPSAQSAAVSYGVGLTSIIAAPLYVGGVLLGVMSVARSSLTDRTEPHYAAADRNLFGAVAGRVATAIENAKPLEADCQATLGRASGAFGVISARFLAPDRSERRLRCVAGASVSSGHASPKPTRVLRSAARSQR